MRLRSFLFFVSILAFAVSSAQAGAIRDLGGKIKDGSTQVASAAAHGGAVAVSGVESAGKATPGVVQSGLSATKDGAQATGSAAGGVIKTGARGVGTGAADVAKGAANVSGAVAHGTASAVKGIWGKIF